MRPIDTEDLRATGSFLEIGDVVFGKLPAQVEADYVELRKIAHVPVVYLPRYRPDIVCSTSHQEGFPCGARDKAQETQYTPSTFAKS